LQEDDHLLAVCRYVERNALRAGLVARAEDWPWSSLWRRTYGPASARALLAPSSVPCPAGWLEHVNAAETEAELASLRRCVSRGQPFGGQAWARATAERLKLGQTLRPRGRLRKRRCEPDAVGGEPSLF
jgi:putative transposase